MLIGAPPFRRRLARTPETERMPSCAPLHGVVEVRRQKCCTHEAEEGVRKYPPTMIVKDRARHGAEVRLPHRSGELWPRFWGILGNLVGVTGTGRNDGAR